MGDISYHASSEFDELVEQCMAHWKVPGLALAFINGEDITVKNYGHSRLSGEKVSDRTLFDSASTSKSFTAAALALIVSNDEKYPHIQWKTPVSELLPDDFVLADPMFTKNVTLEDILSHRSGLPGHDDSYLGVMAAQPDTPRSITRNLRNLQISRGLREELQYSNIMFTVASYLVETVTQKPFAEFIRENFWNPLGMNHTYMGSREVQERGLEANLARPYTWDEKQVKHISDAWLDEPEAQGAGGIFSCAGDYAKWVRCRLHQSQPLPKAAHTALDIPRIIADPERILKGPFKVWSHSLYSLGYEVRSFRGARAIGHDGSVNGFETTMLYLPDYDWGIVGFGNEDSAGYALEVITNTLLDRIIGTPVDQRADWLAAVRQRLVDRKQQNEDEWNRSWSVQELEDSHDDEPTPTFSELAGKYRNAGYHRLVFGMKDGNLYADCTDRSTPHFLTLRHVKGWKFTAEYADTTGFSCLKRKALFRRNEIGSVSFGWDIVEELPDEFVWFDRED